MREHSIRTNRRTRFINCITRDDVDIGTCDVAVAAVQVAHPSSTTAQARLEWCPGRPKTACVATAPGMSLHGVRPSMFSQRQGRGTCRCQKPPVHLHWRGNDGSMHRLRSIPFPEGAKDSTSQYGTKLRLTFLVHGREYDYGCRDARSGCVNSVLQAEVPRSHNLGSRVLNVYYTYGRSGILLAVMCKVSTTWSLPSSKFSCPHISVCPPLQLLGGVDLNRLH